MQRVAFGSIFLSLSLAMAAEAQTAAGPLLDAVRNSEHARIRSLLTQHVDVNTRLSDQSTVLSWAIDRQDEESVDLLLKAGAKPDLADSHGTTSMIVACQGGSPGIVLKLLAAGAGARDIRWDGVSVLSLCSASSTPDVLEKMIAAGAAPDEPNPQGQTPVMYAASRGRIENVAVLVKHGADINRASRSGFTPLFFAVKSGVEGAPQAIIAAGADASYVAPDGTTALHLALFSKNMPVAEYLIDHGADVKSWNLLGKQPLHVAAETGDLKLARLLLAKGADPNALTKTAFRGIPIEGGVPPANNSAAAGPGARRALASSAPSPASDGDWKPRVVYRQVEGLGVPTPPPPSTPLLTAARAGSVELMKALVESGASPAFRSSDGTNIVLAAAGSGSLEAVKFAVQADPDLKVVAGNGSTVMHVAVQNSRAPEAEAIIQYLADHQAPLDGKNARGQTPSDLAERATPQVKALYAKLVAAREMASASGPRVSTVASGQRAKP